MIERFKDNEITVYSKIVSSFSTNCYIIYNTSKEAIIIDPGDSHEAIIEDLDSRSFHPIMILFTHSHIDHIMASNYLKDYYDIPVGAHESIKDLIKFIPVQMKIFGLQGSKTPIIDRYLLDDEIIFDRFKVIATPGHCPDSICLYGNGILFSGDTLFKSSIGRTDLPGGCHDTLIHSISSRLLTLPGNTIVFPGHGPETTIQLEKAINPFL